MNVAEKEITADGKLWMKKVGEQVHLGFTQNFLVEVHQCWQVMPANRIKATEKAPLLSIETNEALFSVSSPVSGEIYSFNDKAINTPDGITEEDVICTIGPVRTKAKVTAPRNSARLAQPTLNLPDAPIAVDEDMWARIRRDQQMIMERERARRRVLEELGEVAVQGPRLDVAQQAAPQHRPEIRRDGNTARPGAGRTVANTANLINMNQWFAVTEEVIAGGNR